MQVLADLPKEVVPLIAEQQRLLADESVNRQMVEVACNAKLFAAEQRQAQWYVDRKLLEAEQVELKQQLHQRDELDRHIEARVLTMMDRLREVESENVQLKFSMQQQAAAFAAKIATATAVPSAVDHAVSSADAASPPASVSAQVPV